MVNTADKYLPRSLTIIVKGLLRYIFCSGCSIFASSRQLTVRRTSSPIGWTLLPVASTAGNATVETVDFSVQIAKEDASQSNTYVIMPRPNTAQEEAEERM
jgi:hypothetical protein